MKHLAGVWLTLLLVLTACGVNEVPPVEVTPQATPAVITQWTFEGDTTAPSRGSGTASLVGGTTATFAGGNEGGRGWNTSRYPAQGTAPKSAGVQFAVSTEGGKDIALSFDVRASNTAANTLALQYSADGGVTFSDATSYALSGAERFIKLNFDFSEVDALENNPDTVFRIVTDFAAGTTQYAAANAGSNYGTTGTLRFDNVTVSGFLEDDGGGEDGGTTPNPATCELDSTPIHAVQSGTATGTVTVEGVVTADFREGLNGFFIQDIDQTAFPETSDGVFVFTPSASDFRNYSLEAGDLLRVTANVGSFQGATQLTFVSDITTCLVGVEVEPTALTLPLEPGARAPYVGMLTALSQDLTVTETFLLGRFGMLSVAEGGRLYHPNNGNVPGTPEEIRTDNVHRRLIVDDGSTAQNPALIPFLSRDPNDTIRVGDTMQGGVVGVMSFSRPSTFAASGAEDYRLHVIDTTAPEFDATNPRPETPAAVGGEVKVASFNVLNYFTTFGQRGAANSFEFERQRVKLIEAIRRIDADAVGLIEIENNGDGEGSAIRNLVDGLNEAYGAEVYAVAPDPADTGTDAIKQAFIYKPAVLELLGVASDTAEVHNRPPVAATFRQVAAPGGVFSAVVAHHKSKRCSAGFDDRPGDTEQGFEGCFNQLRTEQSAALRAFVADLKVQRSDTDVLVMGDLNAYALETPITTFTSSGFEDLTRRLNDLTRYSFVFDGESGTLDYALASATLAAQVTGVDIWHINPDEPRALEYDSAPRFGGEDRYTPTPFRSSDHDPVIVGLSLSSAGEPEPTPQEALSALQAQVEALSGTLNRGQLRSLLAQLDTAERHLGRAQTLQAVRALGRFEDGVRRLVRQGALSQAQGQPLLDGSSAVRALL